jgi:hypothetical protein
VIVDVADGCRVAVAPSSDLLDQLRWLQTRLVRNGVTVPAGLDELVAELPIAAALHRHDVANVGHTSGGADADPSESTTTWVSVTEACRLIGVPDRTLRRHASAGRYPRARRTSSGWLLHRADLVEGN